MAHFRATIQGYRGEASRLGSASGGMVANVNGWNCGIRVESYVDSNGEDTFDVYVTAGSSGGGYGRKKVGSFTANDLKEASDDSGSIPKTTAMVAAFGDLLAGDTKKEKNDWKARMLKAGLENSGLIMPDDWDSLSEDEKERRLNEAIKVLR